MASYRSLYFYEQTRGNGWQPLPERGTPMRSFTSRWLAIVAPPICELRATNETNKSVQLKVVEHDHS
jgi:hypothetical protein